MTIPRILVVEDEAPLALMLRYNLEAAHYAVECADRGDEAERIRVARAADALTAARTVTSEI